MHFGSQPFWHWPSFQELGRVSCDAFAKSSKKWGKSGRKLLESWSVRSLMPKVEQHCRYILTFVVCNLSPNKSRSSSKTKGSNLENYKTCELILYIWCNLFRAIWNMLQQMQHKVLQRHGIQNREDTMHAA